MRPTPQPQPQPLPAADWLRGATRSAALCVGLNLILCGGLLVGTPPAQAAGAVWIGRYAEGLAGWREVVIKPELKRNRFQLREWDGASAVEVVSEGAMSLLARAVTVDMKATPVLCWRWRVEAPLQKADMKTRAGDDYAARLYVSLKIPEAEQGVVLRTKLKLGRALWGADLPDAALNYVWDNRYPVGTEMPNAYTDRTMMRVQRSGTAQAGAWVWERRDVAADALRLFGPHAQIAQVAIASDTDNTGERAQAGFADLHFTAADAPCPAP